MSGDWDLRGIDADQAFARPELSDDALDAAIWTTAKFSRTFPGWQLYRRIIAGFALFEDELDAWVVGGARLLARARKRNGRSYIEHRGAWVEQAARDALETAVTGKRGYSASERGREYGVDPKTWLKIYRPMLACLIVGLETYRAELHANYRKLKILPAGAGDTVVLEGGNFARIADFQSGNSVTPDAPNPDNLGARPWPDVLG